MYITALDIGSAKIKALVAEVSREGQLSLLGVFEGVSSGIRKGEIADLSDALSCLKQIFSKIRDFNRSALKNIFVNVNGAHIKCQSSKGIVAVSRADNEISEDDIDRVVKASQAIKLLSNRMILHTITKEFVLDGVSDIRDPLGMTGTRLEVNSLIIDAFSPNVKNLISLIESVGGEISGLIYGPLASSRSILTKIQKDLGVALIDIGAGTTGLNVYEEGKLLHAVTFPVGANNITNDLAIGLKCSPKAAELIKIFFGEALAKGISPKEKITPSLFKEKTGIDLKEADKNFNAVISRRFIGEIIEIRLAEIFEFINNELRLIGRSQKLPAGSIIVGGGAKLAGVIELAKRELKLSAEAGLPEIKDLEFYNAEFSNQVESPEYAAVLGLLFWAGDKISKDKKHSRDKKFSIRGILRYFAP